MNILKGTLLSLILSSAGSVFADTDIAGTGIKVINTYPVGAAPHGMEATMNGFRETGAITEPRAKRFPEYVGALWSLSTRKGFKVIPIAGWNRHMADRRSDAYDAITKKQLEPYDLLFNDEIGPGGWTHHKLSPLPAYSGYFSKMSGQRKRIMITYGAGHKYWFLEQLKKRDDIALLKPAPVSGCREN